MAIIVERAMAVKLRPPQLWVADVLGKEFSVAHLSTYPFALGVLLNPPLNNLRPVPYDFRTKLNSARDFTVAP